MRQAEALGAPVGAARPAGPGARRRVPRSSVWAALGTALAFLLLLAYMRASGQGILLAIRAGAKGPSAAVISRDFPGVVLPDDTGLDGQQFYTIARDPFHPKAVAPSLGAPRYRYSRPLYPALAWLLHPSGGGPGLVWAMIAVSLGGVFVGALAIGALSDSLRGPPWLAALYPLLPGTVWALTTSVADALAVSLSLLTVVAVLRNRSGLAVLAAVAAALTRETTILVPLALVLARRRKADVPLLVLPAVALGAWLAVVHVAVPAGGGAPEHLVLPFTGLVQALRSRWLHGHELVGMGSTVSAVVVGAFVLARRRGPSELRWVVAVQMAFLAVCSARVLGNDFGGTRSTLTLLAVAIVVLVSGTRGREAPSSIAPTTTS